MATQPKVWWKSRTIWLNVIGLAISIVTTLATQKLIAAEISAAVLAILNLALRFLTNQQITLNNPAVPPSPSISPPTPPAPPA